MEEYRMLRNHINSESKIQKKILKKQYSDKHIKRIRSCDSHKWWTEIQQLTGTKRQSDSAFNARASNVADSDIQQLAELFINSLKAILSDLTPTDPSNTFGDCEFLYDFVRRNANAFRTIGMG